MSKRVEEMSVRDVLREFVDDVDAAAGGPGQVRQYLTNEPIDWPDLFETYRHARYVLGRDMQMRAGDTNTSPLKITKWIATGETSGEAGNVRDLLEELGNLLDHACSHDIFGDVIFECEDGITYVATVEGNIDPANPAYVKEILAQNEEDEEEDDPGSVDAEVAAQIHKLDRAACVKLLEGAGIQCYDKESVETLREAVIENVADGTIDPEDLNEA